MNNEQPEQSPGNALPLVDPVLNTGIIPAIDGNNIVPAVDTADVITIVGGIAAAVGAAFASPVGIGITMSIALLNVFLPHILPGFFSSLSAVTEKQARSLVAAIDNAILQSVINAANSQVEALTRYYNNIADLFMIWKEGVTEESRRNAKTQLQAAYLHLQLSGISEIQGAFTRSDFGGALLAQFSVIAARYLAAIKDFYTYADELELVVVPPQRMSNIKEWLLAHLKADIATLTNMGVASYRQSKNQMINGTGAYKRSWDDFNNYRTIATTSGLDLIAAFQYLDPELYPNGCHARYLNRRLLTFLNTTSADSALVDRGDILTVEHTLNRDIVTVTNALEARFRASGFIRTSHGSYLDGFSQVEFQASTTDGYNFQHRLGITGSENIPNTVPTVQEDIRHIFEAPCVRVYGKYNTAYKTAQGTSIQTCIVEVRLEYFKDGVQHVAFLNLNSASVEQFREYLQTVPISTSIEQTDIIPDIFSGRLANIVISVNGNGHHSYAFWWYDHSVITDLLPERSHLQNQESIKVEQFHAIRAGKSIINDGLITFPGPGFTGSDLVELPAGFGGKTFSLKWRIQRDPQRWFAGVYRVRIWYVNKSGQGPYPIKVTATSTGNISSAVTFSLMPTVLNSNPESLQLKDLQSHTSTMNQILIITNNMPYIELTLSNEAINDLSKDLIIDRLELIFDSAASDPAESGEAVTAITS